MDLEKRIKLCVGRKTSYLGLRVRYLRCIFALNAVLLVFLGLGGFRWEIETYREQHCYSKRLSSSYQQRFGAFVHLAHFGKILCE